MIDMNDGPGGFFWFPLRQNEATIFGLRWHVNIGGVSASISQIHMLTIDRQATKFQILERHHHKGLSFLQPGPAYLLQSCERCKKFAWIY